MKMIKDAFRKGIFQGTGFALGLMGSTVLLAATVAGTVNTFATGDLLDSAKINENFASLKAAIEAVNPQFSTNEIATDRKWTTGSTIYTKVIDTGGMPNNTCKTVVHGLGAAANYNLIRFSGLFWLADRSVYFPFPHANPDGSVNAVRVSVEGADIRICTGTDLTTFTNSHVILEYTKN